MNKSPCVFVDDYAGQSNLYYFAEIELRCNTTSFEKTDYKQFPFIVLHDDYMMNLDLKIIRDLELDIEFCGSDVNLFKSICIEYGNRETEDI